MYAHRNFSAACLVAIATLTPTWEAVASTTPFGDRAERRVEVELASAARSTTCTDETLVSRELTVCGTNGCQTIDVSERERFSFQLESGSKASFELGASTVYEVDGIVTGDSVADVVRGTSALPEKLTQSVAGKGKCIFSFSYRIRD